MIYEAIRNAAQMEGIAPKAAHDTFTAQQAVYLVSNTPASRSSPSLPL